MTHDTAASRSAVADDPRLAIESLVDDLDRLSRQSLSAPAFHAALLSRTVAGLAAVAGAVWTVEAGRIVRRDADWQWDATGLADRETAGRQHLHLVQQAAQAAEPFAVPPAENGQAANPTASLLLFAPVRVGDEVVGVLEIVQRPGTTRAAQAGFLRFLSVLSDLVGDFHRRQRLDQLERRAALWGQIEQFAQRVHARLDLKGVAFALANEGRRLVGCDRLSVARMRGTKCRLLAISGQDTFDRRANVVRRLEQLATAVVAADDPLWSTDETAGLPPQIEDLLQPYLDESHARRLAILPLHQPAEPDTESEPTAAIPVGALIVEWFEAARDDDSLRQRVDAVRRHGELALHNALAHRSLPLYPLLHVLQKSRWLTRARQLPVTILVLAAVAAVVAALVFIPADFTIEGRGELQPVLRRDVFAGIDGVVEPQGVHIEHGQTVAAGDLLVSLRSPALSFERERVTGELRTTQTELVSTNRLLGEMNPRTQEDRQRARELSAKAKELAAKEESLSRQLAVLKEQEQLLEARSPIDGQVLTWDVRTLLESRPVKRGQALLRVGQVDGPWEVEARIPDEDMGHIQQARRELGNALKVQFVLATDPGTIYEGTVKEVSRTTDVDDEEGASAVVRVAIDRDKIPLLRPGATVVPKIDCGRRPVGYVWFHSLWDAVRTYVLF